MSGNRLAEDGYKLKVILPGTTIAVPLADLREDQLAPDLGTYDAGDIDEPVDEYVYDDLPAAWNAPQSPSKPR